MLFIAVYWGDSFHCCLLGRFLSLLFVGDVLQCFAVFLIVKVFTLIILMTKDIVRIWKFFRYFRFFWFFRFWFFYFRFFWLFFLPLFLLKYFHSQTSVTQWLMIFFIFRSKYRKKKRRYGLPASLCVPKSKTFLYLYRSCLILGAIQSFVKNTTIALKIVSATFLTYSKLTPSWAFLALKSVVVTQQLELVLSPDKAIVPLALCTTALLLI